MATQEKREVQKRTQPIVSPVRSEPREPRQGRRQRAGWCKFKARGRAYIEGAYLDEAEQEITLSPAAAYRQRNNKNLELIEGEIPTLPIDAPENPGRDGAKQARRDFELYEREFIEDLEDGDPIVGPPVTVVKLIKQG